MPSPNNSLQGKQKQHHSFNDNKKTERNLAGVVCVSFERERYVLLETQPPFLSQSDHSFNFFAAA